MTSSPLSRTLRRSLALFPALPAALVCVSTPQTRNSPVPSSLAKKGSCLAPNRYIVASRRTPWHRTQGRLAVVPAPLHSDRQTGGRRES